MKILICTDDGELLDTIEHVEEYNLEKPLARAAVIEKIQDAVKSGAARRE